MENSIAHSILELSTTIFPKALEIRKYLHAHPELSWQEKNTSLYIQQVLEANHISFQKDIATHGIVATIEGQNPSQRCIALRADMDALPIQEMNEVPYKSIHAGVMHACGHDVHMSCLLGAALVINELKDQLEGSVKFIFQPSEETQPSGAEAMIMAGILQNPTVNYIIGMHVTPELESGKIGYHFGQFMASADEVYLTVKGRGGHAAQPHKIIDPILISSHILIAMQQIVSRHANPSTPTVLSFGDIRGLGATNIIPDKVEIKGTLRTFDEVWRREAHHKIETIAKGIAQAMGGDCEVTIPTGLPFVENNLEVTNRVLNQLGHVFSPENLMEMPIRMGSEDFGYFSQEIPATFLRLGTKKMGESSKSLHTNTFDIDEMAILHGIRAFSISCFE